MFQHFYRKFDFSPRFVFEGTPEQPNQPAASPPAIPEATGERAAAAAQRVEAVQTAEMTEQDRTGINVFITELLMKENMTIEVGSAIRERFTEKIFTLLAQFRTSYSDWLSANSHLKFKLPEKLAKMEKREALLNLVSTKFGDVLSAKETSSADITDKFLREFVEGNVSPEAKANLQKIFEEYFKGLAEAIQETNREWKLSRLSVEFQAIFQEWSQTNVLIMDANGTLGVDAEALTKALEGKPQEERQKIMGDLEALRGAYNQQQEDGEKVGGILAKGGILAGLMEMVKALLAWLKSLGAELGIKPEKEEKPQAAAGASGEQPEAAEAQADTPEKKTIAFLKEQLNLDDDEVAFLQGARVAQILKGEIKPPADFDKDRWSKLIELLKKNGAEETVKTDAEKRAFALFQEKFEKNQPPSNLAEGSRQEPYPAFQTIREQLQSRDTTISIHPGETLVASPDPNKAVLTIDICSPYTGEKLQGVLQSLALIEQKTGFPVILFVTGIALQSQEIRAALERLKKLPHVSIQTHGFKHRPCTSQAGDPSLPKYFHNQHPTGSLEMAYREIVEGAQAIQALTGKKPKYFRSATRYSDPRVEEMVRALGMEMVSQSPGTDDGGSLDTTGGQIKKGAIYLGHATNSDGIKNIYGRLEQNNIQTIGLV